VRRGLSTSAAARDLAPLRAAIDEDVTGVFWG
jgi:hypothetical protein